MESSVCSMWLQLLVVLVIGTSSSQIPSQESETLFSKPQEHGRQYHYISNRDSYADAANSFGQGQGNAHAGGAGFGQQKGVVMSSYQVPQSSYGAPSQSYGVPMNEGHGWPSSSQSQSSKGGGGDLAGLIGLVGLAGLKGTIPVIKTAIMVLIALLPILLPLSLFKLFILLLKPVFTFGRGISSGGSLANILRRGDVDATKLAEKLRFLEFNSTDLATNSSWSNAEEMYNDIVHSSMSIGNDILGKDADNQCMQRIACEGVFKSLPRIFFRVLGDNSYVARTQKASHFENSNYKEEEENKDDIKLSTARRKDLATTALNRLKNSKFLTKNTPTYNDKNTLQACRQFKCSTLF